MDSHEQLLTIFPFGLRLFLLRLFALFRYGFLFRLACADTLLEQDRLNIRDFHHFDQPVVVRAFQQCDGGIVLAQNLAIRAVLIVVVILIVQAHVSGLRAAVLVRQNFFRIGAADDGLAAGDRDLFDPDAVCVRLRLEANRVSADVCSNVGEYDRLVAGALRTCAARTGLFAQVEIL